MMLYMIYGESCPYCAEAKKNLQRLFSEFPHFCRIPMGFLGEGEKLFAEWDHYYIPAFFWDKEKLAEGCYRERDLKELMERAYDLWRSG